MTDNILTGNFGGNKVTVRKLLDTLAEVEDGIESLIIHVKTKDSKVANCWTEGIVAGDLALAGLMFGNDATMLLGGHWIMEEE